MPSLTKKRPSRKPSKKLDRFEGYQIVVRWSEDDGCYLAYAPALSGCITHGSTPEKAIGNCKEAVELWLRDARFHGDFIPKPARGFSGKMTLRIPASLHRRIAEEAEREGISINQWVMYKLAS
jgi:antitoxin HicB